MIVAKNMSTNQVIFYGPGPNTNTNLPPGIYNITYQLKLSNINSSNKFLVQLPSYPPMGKSIMLSSFVISGANFSVANEWTNITFKVQLDNFYTYLQFILYAISNINGTLELKKVSIQQIGEPTRSSEFMVLKNIMSLIPENSTILAQSNLPSPVPELSTDYKIIFSNNLTVDNHYWNNVNCRIDYVLADLNSSSYTAGSPSMYNFTNLFYGSGNYGILAEASSIALLERNYTGPILYYRPTYREFSASSLTPGSVYNSNIDSKLINGMIVAAM